ncbi:thioredoxin-dependent thiol peroxidase [Candidatus Sumerlaeota bacterium]|nr:thioredoxin-dependent thiol peroxidase [Candidatus Sumerlaeota bacterium]
MLKVGQQAPEFALKDQHDKIHRLSDYRGKLVVLYWYPKDSTPGCTKEACGFRDQIEEFKQMETVVLGVSILDTQSKAEFAEKYQLSFPLLADEDHAVAERYGVWKEKSMYGRKFWGVNRETFLIDPDGVILKHWDKAMGNEAHSGEVLEAIRQLLRS